MLPEGALIALGGFTDGGGVERKPGNHDLAEVRERIRRYVEEFARDGTRIAGNLDFG